MAHIQINKPEAGLPIQLLVNGVDLTMETYLDFELVSVGDQPEFAEIGFRFTVAVTTLNIDTKDVELTDHFPEAAARVHSIVEKAKSA